MDNPFNSTFVSNLTYPNASDPNFYDTPNPTQTTIKIEPFNKYIIIGCVLGGFFFILLCVGCIIALKLLKRAREKRQLEEKNWVILKEDFPDSKLRHSLFDSSFTIAVEEASKIPETPVKDCFTEKL